MFVVGKKKGRRSGSGHNLPIKKRPKRQSSQHAHHAGTGGAGTANQTNASNVHATPAHTGQSRRTVSPDKTPKNPYIKKGTGATTPAKNTAGSHPMTRYDVLMTLGRQCVIPGCAEQNCFGNLCLESGMCSICGEKGQCPSVTTGRYKDCKNIGSFGQQMKSAVSDHGYCTRCLAPWRFGRHHTRDNKEDCVIHSRLQRVVLEKKPPGQPLGRFVRGIVSTQGNYNDFLCEVVAEMIIAKKTKAKK